MSFGLLGFPREPKPDPVTAETRRWLAAEAQRVADDDALVEAARQHRAQADADLVATAERLGDEAGQRDRQAAIDGAATTLRAHAHRQAHSWGSDRCACGWWGPDHVQHVAEQLAAAGALGDLGPKLPAPRPTPRTGSFASGEKRTFADGDD